MGFARRLTAIVANMSLLLNSFLPFILAIQPVYAQSPEEAVPIEEIIEQINIESNQAPEHENIQPEQPKPEITPEIVSTPALENSPTPENAKPSETPTPINLPEPTAPAVEITPIVEATPTPEITTTPTPISDPELNLTPTPVNSEIGSLVPDIELTPTSTPTEELTTEKICLTDETIIDSTNEYWTIDETNKITETKEKVKLGVKYIFPNENKVSVTFKCLPKDESLRTTLKIQQIKTSELNLPDNMGNIGEYAFDITTGMTDGSFEYDVTLPKANNSDVEVSYIEKSVDDAKNNEIKVDEIKSIEESKTEQQSDTVKAKDIDHFTIYITTYSDATFSIEKDTYARGETVYVKAGDLNISKFYKIRLNPVDHRDEAIYSSCFDPVSSSDVLTYNYLLPGSARLGNWEAVLRVHDNSGCTDDDDRVVTDYFDVVDNPITPVTPTVCNDPSDNYSLNSSSGVWTDVDGGSNVNGEGSNEVKWGNSTGYGQSGLKFDAVGIQTFNENTKFLLGTLTHLNWPISNAANGATLRITLSFSEPQILPNPTFDYYFNIEETPNNGNCAYGGNCNDKITFPASYGSTVITIDDIQYTLVIDGFVNSYGCGSLGTTLNYFITEEFKNNTAYLVGHLSSVLVEKPEIRVTKKTNDQDISSAPGPEIGVGEVVNWSYIVQNSGNVDLTGITVVDNPAATISCPKTTLVTGEVMTCTALGTAILGQYHNTVTVTGTPSTGSNVTAQDESWYKGINRKGHLIVQKTTFPSGDQTEFTTNLLDAAGATIASGIVTDSHDKDYEVNVGTYSVNENIINGWAQTSNTCNNVSVGANETKYCTIENKKLPVLTIEKVLVGETTPFTNFSFIVDGVTAFPFESDGNNQILVVSGQTYNITEVNPGSNYHISYSAGCSGNLTYNQTATCIITNTKYGSLTVIKDANPNSSQSFSFTTSGVGLSNFSLSDDGGIFGNERKTFTNLLPGIYSVVEIADQYNDWDLANVTCSNGSLNTAINLSAGENITCTFTNNLKGSISGHKYRDADGNTSTIDDRVTVPNWTIELWQGGSKLSTTTTDQNGAYSFTKLTPGNYTLVEVVTPGWYVTPTSGSQNLNITLTPGLISTDNDFINTQFTSITVHKNVDTDGDGDVDETHSTAWKWNLIGNVASTEHSTGDTVSGLYPGSYTISEQQQNGYFVNSLVCNNGIVGAGGPENNYGAVTSQLVSLTSGQNLVCTFTNTKINPVISITKTGQFNNENQNSDANVSETISYNFNVKNEGNITLTNITVTDPLVGLIAITCPKTTLVVGEQMNCTATYAITQTDIDAGKVENTATVDSDESAPDTDDETVLLPKNPSMTVEKSSTTTSLSIPTTVTYSYLVTNTGNITLTGITLSDNNDNDDVNCPATTLAVGAHMTCTATHTFTQAELDLGGNLSNIVTADSAETDPINDNLNIPITRNPLLSIIKTGLFIDGNSDGFANVGETIIYTFTVKNEGNITLTNVTVTDPKVTVVGGPTTLDVGEEDTTTFTASYLVTQADIDAGKVDNTATADSYESKFATDDETVSLPQNPKLSIIKTATPSTYDEVGDVISYSYKVTNTGNITLFGISVVDDKTVVTCPDTSAGLAPLSEITCSASYTIKLADLNNGSVKNTAYATNGNIQSLPDDETVTSVTGKIIIQKQTLPDGSEQLFQFNPSWSIGNFNLSDNGQREQTNLPVGQYSVSEIVPDGWQLTNITCNDPNQNSSSVAGVANSAVINLDASETVTCVFTNTKIPTLTVTKLIVPSNDNGLFNLLIDGNQLATNISNNHTTNPLMIDIGYTHAVTETAGTNTNLADYISVYSGDCDSTGHIVLAAGENKNCTITNTRKTLPLYVSKYEDLNNNQTRDDNENYLDGWTMELYDNNTCTGSPLSSLVTNSITSFPGTAKFENLYQGKTYWVKEVEQNGWTLTTGNCRSYTIHEDIDSNNQLYFGNQPNGTIHGYKWSDYNGDGLNNNQEELLSGWTINLFKSNGDGGFESTPFKTMLTDNSQNHFGWYWFENLLPGEYKVCEANQTGWDQTFPINSDDNCHLISLPSGNSNGFNLPDMQNAVAGPVYSFGNRQQAKVTVYKFHDLNANGTREDNEPFLSDWEMSVTPNGETTPINQFTNPNGFTLYNLKAGQYTLGETIKNNWYQSNIYCEDTSPGVLITAPGEAYGHHGYCEGWNGCGDAATCALWACEVKGYTNLVSYGESKPCTQFNMCHLFNYRGSVQYNWGNWCGVSGVTDIKCSNGSGSTPTPALARVSSPVSGNTFTVNAGDSKTCYVGNYQKATLTVTKDVLGDSGQPLEDNSLFTTSVTGQENKNFSENSPASYLLKPGTYNVSEINIDPVYQLKSDNNISVTLVSGGSQVVNFVNWKIPPKLTISKFNNVSGNLSPGDSVEYTIDLAIQNNEINHLKVTDLLSNGFKYKPGSYKVYLDSTDVTSQVVEPQYHSPGVWDLSTLGTLTPENKIRLVYTADISTDQQPGKYTDLAWAISNYAYDENKSLLATAQPIGYVDTNFVGTIVPIVKNTQNSVSAEVEQKVEGQVLGVSTEELPATGAASLWLIISGLMGTLGFALLKINKKTMLTLLFAILSLGLIAKPVYAANFVLSIQELKTPANTKDLDLEFKALHLNNGIITVKCLKKGPNDSAFSQFGSNIVLSAGGNSSSCDLSLAINDNGSYQFNVEATDGVDTLSKTVSLDYNTSTPGTPRDYRKENINSNNCDFKIHFRTDADNGKTVKVELYRSTDSAFSANNESLVHSVNIGSDQEYDITNSVPDCSKTYYYALRAFDNAGNGSGLIGDKITITTNTTTTETTVQQGTQGAIPLIDAGIPIEEKSTSEEGQEGTTLGGETGQVLGTQKSTIADFVGRHKFISTVIGVGLLSIIIYVVRKIRKNKKK